jgi:hypothetical protein
MVTTTTHATPILSTSAGASSVGKHHAGSVPCGRRRGGLAMQERRLRRMCVSLLSLPFSPFLCFFFVCWCVFLGFPFLFLIYVFFGLPFSCLVLSLLACSCVAIQERFAFHFCASCFYLLLLSSIVILIILSTDSGRRQL